MTKPAIRSLMLSIALLFSTEGFAAGVAACRNFAPPTGSYTGAITSNNSNCTWNGGDLTLNAGVTITSYGNTSNSFTLTSSQNGVFTNLGVITYGTNNSNAKSAISIYYPVNFLNAINNAGVIDSGPTYKAGASAINIQSGVDGLASSYATYGGTYYPGTISSAIYNQVGAYIGQDASGGNRSDYGIANSGSINGGSAAYNSGAIFNAGTINGVSAAILNSLGGSINNSTLGNFFSAIANMDTGVLAGGIFNGGDIGANAPGSYTYAITNYGSILAPTSSNLSVNNGWAIYNSGNIGSASSPGVTGSLQNARGVTEGIYNGTGAYMGKITNAASITNSITNLGRINGISNLYGSNYGTIDSIINQSGGYITGQTGASNYGYAINNFQALITTGIDNQSGANIVGGISVTGYGSNVASINNAGTICAATGANTCTGSASGIALNVGSNGLSVSTPTISTVTNTGSIIGGSGSYGIANAGTISTLNNAQGAGNANNALTYSGNLPTHYNIIINSGSIFGQLAVSSASGSMVFNIYGNTGTTLISGVAASTVAIGTYADVLRGFATLSGVTGTTGSYSGIDYRLVADNSNAGMWNLVFGPSSTDISTAGTVYLSSNLGSSVNPVFDGGSLKVTAPGTITNNFTVNTNGGVIDQNGVASTLSGNITDSGAGVHGKITIVNNGSGGSVTLSGTNTYSGGTEVDAGANLKIASSSALGTGTLALVGTPTVSATLSTTADMTISNPITVAYDPTFNVAPSTTTTISSVIADGGAAGDVVVEGGGTLALTNVNTYTGSTTIASGSTLALMGSGSIANSSSATNNGTFNVRGVSGNVALGGTLTQASSGNLLMNISPVSNQKVLVTGAASLAGGLALNASAGTYTTGKYTLITASGVSGTFGSFSSDLSSYTRLGYTLGYDANSVFLTFTPNVTDSQTSLSNSLASLQGLYNLQTSVINNGLSYDCSLFDVNGLCISTGGRYTNTNTPTGDSTGALVIGGYRVNDNVRVGAYLDQGVSSSTPTGIKLKQHNPLFGAFAVWQARQDGLGAQVKLAAGYNDSDMTVTRAVVGASEAGSGSTSLTSQAVSVVGSYGVEMQGSWIASPYAGIRYTDVKAGDYTESSRSSVTAPLSYASLSQSTTSLLAGIRWSGKLTDRVGLNGSVGVEQDVSNSNSNYTATGVAGLTSIVFNTDINKTRPVASIGTTVSIDKRQQLAFNVMYREEAFNKSSTTSAYGTYTIGF